MNRRRSKGSESRAGHGAAARGTVPTNVMIPRHHRVLLRRLSERTRISQSAYLREAIADLLAKYEGVEGEAAPSGHWTSTA